MTPPTKRVREIKDSDIQVTSLEDESGFRIEVLNLGAAIRSVRIPAPGGPVEAVLSYDNPADHLADTFYMGATLGRYANRIEDARLLLEGRTYDLEEAPGKSGHCLHGGRDGFSHRLWASHAVDDPRSVRFKLDSPDGDQGFPGNMKAEVTYKLLDDWKLKIEYRAESDAPTVVNLANHAYFNLNDNGAAADNHAIFINADRFTPVRDNLIPNGELRDVTGTVFDFRKPALFVDRLGGPDDHLVLGNGFDHNFVLNQAPDDICLAAILWSPQSGLSLKVHTTQPGLQFYTGQYLGNPFRPFEGICLEAQGFPNAPNTPGFPAAHLKPGEVYRQVTVYEFSHGPA